MVCREVPQQDGSIGSRGSEQVATRAERDAVDGAAGVADRSLLGVPRNVPQQDVVEAAGRQGPSRRVERGAVERTARSQGPAERIMLGPGHGPQPDRVIAAGRGQRAVDRTEGDRLDGIRVPVEHPRGAEARERLQRGHEAALGHRLRALAVRGESQQQRHVRSAREVCLGLRREARVRRLPLLSAGARALVAGITQQDGAGDQQDQETDRQAERDPGASLEAASLVALDLRLLLCPLLGGLEPCVLPLVTPVEDWSGEPVVEDLVARVGRARGGIDSAHDPFLVEPAEHRPDRVRRREPSSAPDPPRCARPSRRMG